MSYPPRIRRYTASNVRFRDDSGSDGRTIYGLAVPYGVEIAIGDGTRERIAPGAFGKSINERGSKVKLLNSHDYRRLPIGRATDLREDATGLHAAFEIARTREGDDALELVRSGTVDSFSIGFRVVRDRIENGVYVRTECALVEVSLVSIPAYDGAAIHGMRSAPPDYEIPLDLARRGLDLRAAMLRHHLKD